MSHHPGHEEEVCKETPTEHPLTPTVAPAPTVAPTYPTIEEKTYVPHTRFYPPSPSAIATGARLFIIEHETGEGFLDFFYCNFDDPTALSLIIEIDGVEWCRITPSNISSAATGLAIDGWYGWLGSQHYSDDDDAYGITIVPVKDCLPYYETLRIWVENTGAVPQTLKRAFVAWRKRK